MTKDYYKILGIREYGTRDEVKQAYRKLARQWHPDVAGNNPSAIARFKEINEAYKVLSSRISKADYDTARRFYEYASGKSSKNKPETDINKESACKKNDGSFSWIDFFVKKGEKQKNAVKGEDIYSDIEISVIEAANGCIKIVNMLMTSICPHCKGRKFINGAECPHCKGKGETSIYKRFNVKIPSGIKNNTKIRLAKEGEKGENGGANGDLYLTVHINEPPERGSLDVLKTVSIAPFEAVLGADITIPSLKGNVSFKISPNTKNGQKIRLAGCGLEQNNKIGDMIVTVVIQIPERLTSEEISLYKQLADISSAAVREW